MQQPMMQQPVKKSRPTGVTILAVLALIGGVLALLGGFALVAGGGLISAAVNSAVTDPNAAAAIASDPNAAAALAAASSVGGGAFMILGIVAIVAGLIDILAAIGLFGLKKWGLTLAVIGQLLSLAGTAYNVVQGTPISGQIVSIAIPILILLYLFSPGVRKAFA
jgi:uncharacterized membrane protein (DUF2068 family)